jgi:hypothetical protein
MGIPTWTVHSVLKYLYKPEAPAKELEFEWMSFASASGL